AENEFAGARCGIMDQLISCGGRANTALLLDCRTLHYRAVPLPQNVSLLVCNTKIKHAHAAGEYNARRADCESGARILGVRALRDVSLATLERLRSALPEVIYRRCRHVVSENARVLDAAAALEQRDLKRCGGLMYESHRSLRDDFQVSCRELDLLVDLASRCDGVYGSRMTGGGFGGCTVSLVDTDAMENCIAYLSAGFEKETHSTLEAYVFNSVSGVEEIRDA
ncbi:MAG TPA: galactokinase, partial [Myxococcaceae bacterium]|nr:galactokinase [Myxococcaceae bacterium]